MLFQNQVILHETDGREARARRCNHRFEGAGTKGSGKQFGLRRQGSKLREKIINIKLRRPTLGKNSLFLQVLMAFSKYPSSTWSVKAR